MSCEKERKQQQWLIKTCICLLVIKKTCTKFILFWIRTFFPMHTVVTGCSVAVFSPCRTQRCSAQSGALIFPSVCLGFPLSAPVFLPQSKHTQLRWTGNCRCDCFVYVSALRDCQPVLGMRCLSPSVSRERLQDKWAQKTETWNRFQV